MRNKTITVDLEAWLPTVLGNATDGIHPGKMSIFSAGRQSGKSTLNQYYGKLWNDNLCKEILLPMKPAPKYKFSRAKWYVADYDWVHQAEVHEWCYHQFGPHPKNPDAWSRWYNNYSEKIHFRDKEDYLMFVLRWG